MIRLHFIDKTDRRQRRPFVTNGDLAPLSEVNHWLWFLKTETNDGAKTLEKYSYQICDFYRYCEAVAIRPVEAIATDLQHYFDDMQQTRGVQPNTINERVRTLENFYKFLVLRRYRISLPFTTAIKRYSFGMLNGTVSREHSVSDLRRRPNQIKRRYLTRGELAEFVKSLPNYRDKAIALLMWATGLRIEEVISLTIEAHLPHDIAGYIRAEKSFNCDIVGKGRKHRIVEIPSEILRDIDHYICSERSNAATSVLFLSSHGRIGKPISTGAIQAAFRRHSEATGIDVTPHKLRHAFAMERLIFWERVWSEKDRSQNTLDPIGDPRWAQPRYRAVKQVSLELGHENIRTTEIYLKHLDTYKAKIHGLHKKWMQQLRIEANNQ